MTNAGSWDELYTNELLNNESNPEDIGTVWFEDSDAEAKILSFLASQNSLSYTDTSFLDLGCGNGSMLFSLRDYVDDDDTGGWRGRMLGVDYSDQSVSLARQIHSTRDDGDFDMDFRTWDILRGPWSTVLDSSQCNGWDVVLDKGTFDAISLSSDKDDQDRRLFEGYRDRVIQLVKKDGYFIITSCNWTAEELKEWLDGREGSGGYFRHEGQVEYPSFSFGGHQGQTITTLCFRKM